jgi:hypothetical protein
MMSKEAASLDLQAAAYWRSVVQADRSDAAVAAIKVNEYKAAARQEQTESSPRRSARVLPS